MLPEDTNLTNERPRGLNLYSIGSCFLFKFKLEYNEHYTFFTLIILVVLDCIIKLKFISRHYSITTKSAAQH